MHRAAGVWRAVFEIGRQWWGHSHSRSAAALAFFSLFSLVPILVVSTALAGLLIGAEGARDAVEQASEWFLDDDSTRYLLRLLEEQSDPAITGWASAVSFLTLLFLASHVVVQLREVLNVIFGKPKREGRRGMMIGVALGRGVPLLLILAMGMVLALSSMAGAVLQLIADRVEPFIPEGLGIWNLIQQAVSLAVVALLFAAVLRWLPAKPPAFRPALGGALVSCVLLALLRGLIGIYFQNAGVTSFYGAAVALVVVLLWIYFTIQIFFAGAETAAYLDRRRLAYGKTDGPNAATGTTALRP
jgi:membrane protein